MIADAWHTPSNSISSVIVIAAFWVSSRSPDENHPYGYGRAENVGGIIIATLLLVVGFSFLKDSILMLGSDTAPDYSSLGIIIFAVSVFIKEGLAQFSIWAGNKVDSPALRADGYHHRSDALSTLLILLGILFGGHLTWLDAAMGILVSFFIIYLALEIIRDTSRSLLGKPLSEETEKKIVSFIEENFPEVSYPNHFHLHKYGDHSELSMDIYLPGHYSLKRVHDITDQIEEGIRQNFSIIATIHPAPDEEAENS